jgi:hypothetical protein
VEEPKDQITIFRHILEQNMSFKVKNILLVLSAIILFGSGFSIAQVFNMKWVMRSYDTGYKTALVENPAAGYASNGLTFCYDQGNYYTEMKKKGNAFYMSKVRRSEPKVILPEVKNDKP